MMQLDRIRIINLELFANHGVYEEETRLGQKFLLDVTAWLDLRKAGRTDGLEDSVNYGALCHFMEEYFAGHTFRLIEAAADHLASAVLKEFPKIRHITIELKKPWAPVKLPLETVSVAIDRGWHTVYLSVGSNMGDRQAHLERAVRALEECEEIRDVKASSFLETKAYGYTDQPDFLNAAVKLSTLYTPHELLGFLNGIEESEKRVRKERWGPRTLDMDIVFYDDLVMEDERLIIPHIDMQNREFVLIPMNELCPGKIHPVLGKTVRSMLLDLQK